MVQILASRAAAMRLSWIVAVLLVPFLVLCFFMVRTLQADLAFVASERSGVAYNRAIFLVYFDAVRQEINVEKAADILDGSAATAAQLGLREKHDRLARLVKSADRDFGKIEKTARELMADSGVASRLISDPDSEGQFLARHVSHHSGDVLLKFSTLRNILWKQFGKIGMDQTGYADILTALGDWRASIGSLQDNLDAAQRFAGDRGVYDALQIGAHELDGPLYKFTRIINNSTPTDLKTALQKFVAFQRGNSGFAKSVLGVWDLAEQRLDGLLKKRQDDLQWRMLVTLATAAAAALLSIALALSMFRSTLKRLDEVEAARDTAESARAEAEAMTEQLSTINEEITALNAQLAANMQRLKLAQDELVKKGRMEQLGQLTATIAHEIRNPLGAVRTSAFLLERKIKDKGLGVESQLERINTGVTRCDNIITQLLDFSRTRQLACTPGDLDQWLARTVEEEAKRLPATVRIDCLLGLDGKEVPFDPARLERAVANLLANASEAIAVANAERARTAAISPQITVSTRARDGFAEISVSDNGPGISAENLVKIREPLFTTKSFGTGLGIPAIEQIATQHGGTLEIESQLGHGAKFTIRIPFTGAAREAA